MEKVKFSVMNFRITNMANIQTLIKRNVPNKGGLKLQRPEWV